MHIPVLLRPAVNSILDGVKHNSHAFILDATFGNGGYTKMLLENPNITVIALDRDHDAIQRAFSLKKGLGNPNNLVPIHGSFSQIPQLLKHHFPDKNEPFLDGMVFDIGVSSNQLDDPKRGFSYKVDGPLDMRMHQSDEYITAASIVNNFSEAELGNIIKEFGEDRQYKKIARAIVASRRNFVISSTVQLANIIKEAIVGKNGYWNTGQRHPALRTFQALRIYINQELKELEAGLNAAESFLKPQGRLAVVSFHSLEDRIVKKFLSPNAIGLQDSDWRINRKRNEVATHDFEDHHTTWPDNEQTLLDYSHLIPQEDSEFSASFRIISRKVIKPTKDEVGDNPRARSAKLRVAERTNFNTKHDLSLTIAHQNKKL